MVVRLEASNGCQVQDLHTRQIVSVGRKVGQLCELTFLQLISSPSISPSVTNSAIYQWHLRLGHASSKKFHKLVCFANLNNVFKFDSFDCFNCKHAKQLAFSFPNSSSCCGTPFGLIHYDI